MKLFSIYSGDADMVNALFQKGANINTPDIYGHSPLHIAAHHGIFNLENNVQLNQKLTEIIV